jgi:hypothetical protein
MPKRFVIARIGGAWPRRGWLATSTGQRALFAVAVLLLAAVPLAVRVVPLGLEEGRPAPRTFRAPRSVQFIDEAATEALRQTAADAVEPVYVFDQAARAQARGAIVEFFSAVASTRSAAPGDPAAQAALLADRFGSRVDSATIQAVVALPDASVDLVARTTEALVSGIMSARISERDLATALDQLASSAELIALDLAERHAVVSVGKAFLAPTFVVDEAATERAREEARKRVSPVVTVVQEGENIVERGDIVTAADIELVRALGGLEQGVDAASVVAGIVLMWLLLLAAGAYISVYQPEVWGRMRLLLLLATLLLGMMYITRLTSLLRPEIPPYLMPVPLAPILATLLVSGRSALVLTVLTTVAALLLGYAGGVQVVATLLASVAAIVAVSGLSRRSQLFSAGMFLVGLLGTTSFGASLASGAPVTNSLAAGAYGLAGGLATAVLAIGLLPFFEYVFGVTTDITLLELVSPGHPLVRRLMTEAPGTYSHSVMTANLAEAAAEAIGANVLLTRAGAYFHDIGKTVRPGFFVENQAGGSNPHDTAEPAFSARIITAHVREGIELAVEHGLPPEVVDIVAEHHGTSVVTYFYDKAAKTDALARETDFRYEGRRPTSREAALVMLADAAEAAVRALESATPERIEQLVRKIVNAKIDDRQLDASALTLADLETVVRVYTRILASYYHPRVEYPEPVERRERHAGERRESS